MDPLYNPHAVLLIADDAAFPRDIVARWQQERLVPGFTVMSTELFHGGSAGNFDLVLLGPVKQRRLAAALKIVDIGSHPVLCALPEGVESDMLKSQHPRVLFLPRREGWQDSVVLLAGECLRRVDLVRRLRKAEQTAAASSRHAALGRYMLENRHDFNNLLTSVMGNAELLKLESGSLPDPARDQLETIHSTALMLFGLMQRFSSIAMGMPAVAEKTSQDETKSEDRTRISAI